MCYEQHKHCDNWYQMVRFWAPHFIFLYPSIFSFLPSLPSAINYPLMSLSADETKFYIATAPVRDRYSEKIITVAQHMQISA